MLIKLKLFIIFILFLSSCSSISGEDKSKISSKISEYLEQKVSSIEKFDYIKNSELSIENKSESFDADYRISVLSSISENKNNFFLNQSNISRQDDDTTVNIGFINRKLTEDKKWLYGFNIFYDQEFPENHQRASLGLEIKSEPIEFNFNYYDAFSKSKTVGDTTEKAMDGYDAEIGFRFHMFQQQDFF